MSRSRSLRLVRFLSCSPGPLLAGLPTSSHCRLARPSSVNILLFAFIAFLYAAPAEAGSDAIQWQPAEIVDLGVFDVSGSTGRSVLFAFDAWHVVYEKSGEIFHRARTASGWEPVGQLTDDPAESRNPHIGLGGGFLHLVWEDTRTGHSEVWTRRWNGTVWSEEECLTCDGTPSSAAVVAGMGNLAQVVWQEGESPSSIQGRRFENGAWQPTDAISSGGGADAIEPTMAFLQDGEHIDVVWADTRLGRYQLFHRSWNKQVGWHGELPITNLPGDCRNPSMHEEICCYDHINPDYSVVFENDQSGVPEVYTLRDSGNPTPWRISANDGVPSIRPNLHGFMFTHSECAFGGVAPSYFVTWTESSTPAEQRIARMINTVPFAEEILSSSASGHSAVGAIEGEPNAGVMALWVEDSSTLYARQGSVTGCYQSAADQMAPVFLVGPEGEPANHFRIIDECTGTPERFSLVYMNLSSATQSALTWDPAQGRPPLSARSDANGDAVFSVRAGGCSEQGGVGLYCLFFPLSGWVGVKSPDISGDCQVTELDLQIVAGRLGTDDFCADLDGSGVVDEADLAIVQSTMGHKCTSIPASIDPLESLDRLRFEISPNPVTTRATIQLHVPPAADPTPQRVEVKILDASGRLVRELDPLEVGSGEHRLLWDATDDHGRPLPSGTYFASVQAGSERSRQVFVVLR